MTVTRGRLGDPRKRSFFRADEESLTGPGGTAPVHEPALESLDAQLSESPSFGSSDDDRKLRLPWTRGLLALWTIIMISTLFEPAPNPHAVVPLWASMLSFLFLTGLFTTVWGLAGNHGWAMKASLATAALGLGMAVACGVTDHHPAFWWGYETIAMIGLLAFSRLALKKISN